MLHNRAVSLKERKMKQFGTERDDGFHSLVRDGIHGSHSPCGPASLTGTSDTPVWDLLQTRKSGNELFHCVHGFEDGLSCLDYIRSVNIV